MAVSSSAAAAALYIACRKGLSVPTPSNSVAMTSPKRRRLFSIRSSDESTAAASVESGGGWEEPDRSVESPQSTPSIITSLNIERALRGIPITDVDHYGRLGLPRQCSNDQVINAYKSKTEELLNQELDIEELNQKIEMLKESYTILSTPEEKRLYDWSLARCEKPERYVWPFEADTTKPPQEEPPAQEPEDVGPTIAVGYFILGWILLSFVLSIALNVL